MTILMHASVNDSVVSNKMNTLHWLQLIDSRNHALHASASASVWIGSEAEA